MFAVASIVSGVRLAGLDGLILILTLTVIGSALIMSRTARFDFEPSRRETTLTPFAAPKFRSLPHLHWLPIPLLAVALLLLVGLGQITFRPNWSAKFPLIFALVALGLALVGGELARLLDLSNVRRAAVRVATGSLLIVAGQLGVLEQRTVLVHFRSGHRAWNFFRIDGANADNVLFAFVVIALGIVFVARGAISRAEIEPVSIERAPEVVPGRSIFNPMIAFLVAAGLLTPVLLRLHDGRRHRWIIVAWLASLVVLAAGAWAADRRTGRLARLGLGWIDLGAVAGLLAVGSAIALHNLATVPNSLWGDEGRFWESAVAIEKGRIHPWIFDPGVYDFPVMSSYVQAWLMQVSEASLWGWRFSSAVPALLAVVPTYLLARELFDRRVAFVASGLLISSPYFLAFARLGYNNSQALVPVALSIYLASVGIRSGSLFLMALSGLSAGAGFYTYGGGRLALLVVPAYVIGGAVLRSRASRGENDEGSFARLLGLTSMFLAGCFAVAAPLIVYGSAVYPVASRRKTLESIFSNLEYARSIYPGAQLFRDHGPITIDDSQFFFRADLYVAMIGRGIVQSALAIMTKAVVHEHYIAAPLAGPTGVVLLAIGIGVALSRSVRARATILVWWLVIGFFALAALDSFPPRQAHLVPIIPAIAILAAAGVVQLVDQIARLLPRGKRPAGAVLAVAALLVVGALGVHNYFVVMPERYPPDLANVAIFDAQAASQPVTLLWVYEDAGGRDFVPWGIENLPSRAIFKDISVADLTTARQKFVAGSTYTVFWTSATRAEIEPALVKITGAPVTPVVHALARGEISGYSFTFTAPG